MGKTHRYFWYIISFHSICPSSCSLTHHTWPAHSHDSFYLRLLWRPHFREQNLWFKKLQLGHRFSWSVYEWRPQLTVVLLHQSTVRLHIKFYNLNTSRPKNVKIWTRHQWPTYHVTGYDIIGKSWQYWPSHAYEIAVIKHISNEFCYIHAYCTKYPSHFSWQVWTTAVKYHPCKQEIPYAHKTIFPFCGVLLKKDTAERLWHSTIPYFIRY